MDHRFGRSVHRGRGRYDYRQQRRNWRQNSAGLRRPRRRDVLQRHRLGEVGGRHVGQYLATGGAGANPSWGTPPGAGDITAVGDYITGACFVDGANHTLTFEGTTTDGYEILLSAADATTIDKTLTLPNVTGTLATVDGGQTFTSAIWNGTDIDISDYTNLTASGALALSAGDALSHSTADGYIHLPSGGASAQILQYVAPAPLNGSPFRAI